MKHLKANRETGYRITVDPEKSSSEINNCRTDSRRRDCISATFLDFEPSLRDYSSHASSFSLQRLLPETQHQCHHHRRQFSNQSRSVYDLYV